jgi:hypothetical protein
VSDCHISVELQAILERVFESIDAELSDEEFDAQVDEMNLDSYISECFDD